MNASLEIIELPAQEVAFITQIGVEGLENTFSKLIKWANTNQVVRMQ
jgi:AraC family transcriptional regulator